MFSHIHKFHNQQFLKSTNRKWIEEASRGNPLKLWWTHKNDFDEDEDTIIYVCLSSHKTFWTAARCEAHFLKDKAALKQHNKLITQLKKDFETMRKQEAKKKKLEKHIDPYILRRENAFNTNDPELARSLWRGILNNVKTIQCAMAMCIRSGYSQDSPMYVFDKETKLYEEIHFEDFVPLHTDILHHVSILQQAKCLDVKVLHKLYIETLLFWMQNYQESIMDFRGRMKELQPFFDYSGDEEFYNYATEEMEGVDF